MNRQLILYQNRNLKFKTNTKIQFFIDRFYLCDEAIYMAEMEINYRFPVILPRL